MQAIFCIARRCEMITNVITSHVRKTKEKGVIPCDRNK